MCDVKRQLAKYHVTVRMPVGVAAATKLVEKAYGYATTDGNTPVIGTLSRLAVAREKETKTDTKYGLASWWSKFESTQQFPNGNTDGWMDAEFSLQFPEFDRSVFDKWIEATTSLNDLLSPPLCAEPKQATPTGTPAVVDGDVLPAKEPSSGSPPIEDKASLPSQPSTPKAEPKRKHPKPSGGPGPAKPKEERKTPRQGGERKPRTNVNKAPTTKQ